MKSTVVAGCLAFFLAACGGGGDASQFESAASSFTKGRSVASDPALVAQEISVVNTTTAGDQVFRSIGALADGGYTVAWSSGGANFIQRFDTAGMKVGTETAVAGTGTVALLTGGEVVVACCGKPVQSGDNAFGIGEPGPTAITVSIHDADGALLHQFEAAALDQVLNPFAPSFFSFFTQVRVAALADGGFVVGWVLVVPGRTGVFKSVFVQRYDSEAQPVGDRISVGSPMMVPVDSMSEFISGTGGFTLEADAHGGYTASIESPQFGGPPLVSVVHVDADQTVREVVAPTPGSVSLVGVLLLPLEDRYVLFRSDASGATQQLLDNEGTPVGSPIAISALPVEARELADGSFVVSWSSNGSVTAQRFDPDGAPLGDLITVQSGGAVPGVAALVDGGFALAWSAASTAGDLDVYTQRFTEQPGKAAQKARRKACLESARGMKGQDRQAFMAECMQ
jgi:hypothetical protein